jgi:two-component system CheB/CheR fusion protein
VVEAGHALSGSENSPPNRLRILVVEDYADSALSLELLLRMLGHEVDVAFNGPMAVEIATKSAPDVVILDIGLPGMNGWDVAKSLQEHATLKKPFFIAVTGYGTEEDKCRSSEVGIDLHLVKPVDPQELATVLQRFQRVIK